MSETETRSIIVEREVPFTSEKIWRALTQPHLIAEWLMQNDFRLERDCPFTLRGDWGSVNCRVLTIEPNRTLVYSWGAMGLESTVTWILTPTDAGTHLRMEQTGFQANQTQAFMGAKAGWRNFFVKLEQVLAREDCA
jgi:uncharacterized protein YndB with AHSA1/START domain